ncbi:FtsX-like permease family protein [Pseudoflavitalea sp. G-6-1-2]|uniref:ABC transporter permease n=1 Tax=Pseudoflavitalea sp. G-6-1-2 TaxID=2728841 RepID=UPI00146E11DA|nr:ABC transporter permease [Pseudoflavitalea sp. G-6-1-2]NML23672.1 FtsX-like permease family protein [Pseudoflavitalea sp. G-6-1-2]
MLRNYFLTAWRNLRKNRFYTSINIAGLAIGLAVGLIILLWVNDENSFDRFHTNAPQLYRVIADLGSGESKQTWSNTPAPVALAAMNGVPGVQNAVRIVENDEFNFYTWNNQKFRAINSSFVDPSFFTIFDFKLKSGNKNLPFPDNNSILITEKTATQFFGKEDPIGKTITADNKYSFTVRGVVEDLPSNSSIQSDMFFPIDILSKEYTPNRYWKTMETDWGNYYCSTYLLLQPNAGLADISGKLTAIHRKNNQFDANGGYHLQPMADMHLYGIDGNKRNKQMVNLFLGVAILLLTIASINYVNLSTARAMLRAREVSVRKIVGAGKLQLFMQFICETLLLFVIASVLAICIIYLLMPVYNNLSGKSSSFSLFSSSTLGVIGITIAGTLIAAAIYPALLLTSFKPILALKGKLTAGIGNNSFRKVLVIAQFTLAVIMIVSTLIIGKQLQYLRSKELGFDRSQVFCFQMRDLLKNAATIKAQLANQTGVLGVSTCSSNIVKVDGNTGDTDWDGKEANRSFLIHPVNMDKDFMNLMKLQLVAGKQFTGTPADSNYYILNETAVKNAGITDPIGKRFSLWERNGTIIGVVKDFHCASMKEAIEPVIFYTGSNQLSYVYVKTEGQHASQAIAAAEKVFKQYNSEFPFEYSFLDDTFDRLYRADQRMGNLFNIFAVIAILISCLGLFGLAAYTAQVRTREIGIRKVLGASVGTIAGMLTKDFVKLVLIAVIIASPIAWYAMKTWLQDFVYRTNISIWIFVASGIIAILIALITISAQTIRAAMANPVKSLKTD